MLESLLKIIMENLLTVVVSPIILYLTTKIPALIESGFHYVEGHIKSQHLQQILHLAEEAVLHSYQTIIKEAKKDFADGKIDAEELKSLKALAKSEAIKMVESFVAGLPKIVKDLVEDKVGGLVESALVKVKAKQRGIPALNPTTPLPDGK